MRTPRSLLFAAFIVVGCRFSCLDTRGQTTDQKLPTNTKARTIVDLSPEELRRLYRPELGRVVFDEKQEELHVLLNKTGDNVEAFFRNMPNTASREQIVSQRLKPGGEVDASVSSSYNYLLLVRPDIVGVRFVEDRTDSKNRPSDLRRLSEYLVTSGFAGHCIILHPSHQYGSRFRYLGRQPAEPRARLIAFAQKPEVGDFVTSISGMEVTPVLLQGLVWIDQDSYQILRMRTDLLEPDYHNGVTSQTTEVWLSEVHFDGIQQVFWLPREVRVTCEYWHKIFRNLHTYSDYKLFTVASYDKIVKP